MKLVFDERQLAHDPQTFIVRGRIQRCPDKPERATVLLAAARAAGHEVVSPDDYGIAPLAAVHTPEYLDFLEHIHAKWRELPDPSDEVTPNIHPNRNMGERPRATVGLAGYHQADTACPITPDTWDAARASAHTAVHAARLVLAGEPHVYALCRPSGHHAYGDMAGGFCYLNNAAIAAQDLRRERRRIAILDIDVHAGNGTQGIFYHRADVFFVSIHADPADYYPFYAGYAHERGLVRGLGHTLNLPLPLGTETPAFMEALDRACAAVTAYAPEALVLSLGLDIFEGDPLKGFRVTADAFTGIGAAIARLSLPTVLIQEGGYPCDELGGNLTRFLAGFEAAHKISN
ncbi:MAG TPA: histone deacetylase family protein [Aestuariivirgaceae bacterium]|nr:histone deacetylase family protein [Aestuariivirgaceae bacterium]